ncbi:hypothetical protein SUGI_0527350 [Cryptomeria japonica]|uniref:AAA-ATPase At5g57480 n=1 Tax=Cryptomeria japonica TaxID=3369 RepID=UPI002408A9E6|nr:AAA-ATPase At5g57480 [Cryptomeria japonica]GLJ26938.1 hypothetical protein SUGI_0527350 [Cryptomeria japonica]
MELWTSMASVMGVLAFSQTLIQAVLPPELRYALSKFIHHILRWFSAYSYFDIMEVEGVNTNELYSAVQLHLSNSPSISATRVNLSRAKNSSSFSFSLANNDKIVDKYKGVTIWWEHSVTQRQNQAFSWRPLPEEKRGFVLCIHKKDTERVLNSYLEHIMEHASQIRRKNQDRLLYTNSKGGGMDSRAQPWESVPFKHPSTFDTLALDPVRKSEIIADLEAFATGKEFYQNTGRAWKRGYLLYGPPGTGKSSMIAAMANHLCYDVYDLELTEVHTNAELRKLLIKTTNKSIIVIEDIDCSLNLSDRSKRPCRLEGRAESPIYRSDDNNNSITLSGLLNFTDGLWSCCGSERIFVFTTNHIEKLDPALLRSGRMDMHILMSFCTFPALKILVRNYLGLEKHELFLKLEQIIQDAQMTPADVSEILIKYHLNPTRALEELFEAFKAAKERPPHGSSFTREENPIEEYEEQEKRALDTPQKIDKEESLGFGKVLSETFECYKASQIAKDKAADAEKLAKSNYLSEEERKSGDIKMQKKSECIE